jgi:hypothetical protein
MTASYMTISVLEEPDLRHRTKLLKIGARQCRFIVSDDPRRAVCCGAPTRENSSWCDWHRRRVYVSTQSGKGPRGTPTSEVLRSERSLEV